MKRYFLILGFIAASLFSLAQHAVIRGSIRNHNDGTGMSNVIVIIDGTINRSSDSQGKYQFSNVEVGEHKLTFALLGYEKSERIVKVESSNEVIEIPEVKLIANAIQINEITISAPPSIYSSRYETSNIIISSKEIEFTRPLGTEEVLKKVAGVNVSGDMGISNRLNVGIRGSYPRRSSNILLMEDGTPIAPAPYLAPEAYYNPPSDRLDGIEILKGADILAYGSNTMYGAINYITKKPSLTPALGVNLVTGARGYHSEYITYGGTWDKIGAEIQVLNKEFNGFADNSNSRIFNTTAKLYTEFGTRSSLYVKLNYHQEKSKASYSALTPYTYQSDPLQNPFDADDLITNRYAIDLIYNYKLNNNIILSSKVYANQFQRDWWRQENTVIKASAAKGYLGDEIYNDRYSYLDGLTYEENDYVRVGRVVAGKESTRARNRTFKVAGVQETIKYNVERENFKISLEGTLKGHWESFENVEIKNDSSRFARSGVVDKDQLFILSAYSGFLKSKFSYKRLSVTPSLRYEIVEMYSYDRLAISKMTGNDGSKYFGSQKNVYSSFIPGASITYDLMNVTSNKLNVFAGIYKGYTAPIADNAFLHVDDGEVSAPSDVKPINREPEVSLNYEGGLRGDLWNQFMNAQLVYFNNNIENFYSAGRNEAFQTLGAVNINGIEASVNLNLHKLVKMGMHEVALNISGTLMNGRVLNGSLRDADMLSAKHTDATKAELIDKINSERDGYIVYYLSVAGQDSLVGNNLTLADFSKIKRLDYIFGEDGISRNTIPYLPDYIFNTGIVYSLQGFSIGANINYVAGQYTDYLNFDNETGEGAIGVLPAFTTIDANVSYSFENHKNRYLKGLSIFVAGKNITDETYKASRLHRVSSGIMPSGFSQVNVGVKFVL